VLALVRSLVVTPHLQDDLQGFFEPLESLRRRREGEAQPGGLVSIPGRADTEHGPSARQHIEGRNRLGQQARLAVGDARNECVQRHRARLRGEKAECRVGLEHLVLRRADVRDLPEVVHDADSGEAGVLGIMGDADQRWCQCRRSAGPSEVGDMQAEFHMVLLLAR
jgi:hypothetical protein